jgi:hypothetical protein
LGFGGVINGQCWPKTKAKKLLKNDRANYIAKADYSNDSEIDQIVKSILDQISLKASVKQYIICLLDIVKPTLLTNLV